MLRQANSRNNRINGENNIHNHDSCNRLWQTYGVSMRSFFPFLCLMGLTKLSKLNERTELCNAFIEQIDAAQQQNNIANGKTMSVESQIKGEKRRGHMHQVRRNRQKDNARNQSTRKTKLSTNVLLAFFEFISGNGNKNNIVYAQDNFKKNKRY